MKTFVVTSAKLTVTYRAGELPSIDVADPRFLLAVGKHVIDASISSKAARKLSTHGGGAILHGRLVPYGDRLKLIDVGFQFLESKPATPAPP
jgi:hypothetical protein